MDARDSAAGGGVPPEAPPTFLDMPCDLLSCLGPVASTPDYEREVDGMQCLCTTARDDTMLGAATADLRYTYGRGARSRLAYACSMNDEARIAWLLECGARDVLAAAEDGYEGGAALVRRLAADPLVDASEALVAAAWVGEAELVAPLVSRGAQLDRVVSCQGFDWTALQAASARGHAGVVAALVAAGANVEAVDADEGDTVLIHAARGGSLEVVRALVAAGADVNRREWHEHSAAAAWAANEERATVAAYLCALPQADPSAHIAAAAWLGDVALVRAFIARGADVEERGLRGATCLMLAAQRGHVGVVAALVAAGADVAAVSDGDHTVLMHAVRGGSLEVVAALLAAGADVAAVSDGDHTVLMHAVRGGSLEVVRALVAAGADVNRRDSSGRTAAAWAADEERATVAAYLCALPQADPSAHIPAACSLGDVALVRALVARGAGVEERGARRATCLMLAAQRGHVEVVAALLEAGADVAVEVGPHCWSALYFSMGRPAVLAALLEGFEVGGDAARQAVLDGALHEAVAALPPEGVESVRLLVAAGANVNARARVEVQVVAIVARLWAGEADVPGEAADGRSALSAAVGAGNVAAARLLLDAGADVRGLDREASPQEEVRLRCRKPEAVPALLAALAGAAAAGGGGGVGGGGRR
jgi:ankyrin repeat protein